MCLLLLGLYLLGRTGNRPPPPGSCSDDPWTWGPCWYRQGGNVCMNCGKARQRPYKPRKGPDGRR